MKTTTIPTKSHARLLVATSSLLVSLSLSLTIAQNAHADDALCVDATERGLALRKAGKLHDALKQLAICADPTCPTEVKEECGRRAKAIDAAIPTLIPSATDANGNDLLDVKVTIDGVAVADKLDGRAIALDPGAHVVKLEGGEAGVVVEKTFVLRESEKDRRENFVLARPVVAPPPPPPPPKRDEPTFGTQKKLALIAGGLGVIGVALGATFGLVANSKKTSESHDCSTSTSCTDYAHALSEYRSATDFATVSTISWVAAGVFLATGAVLYFTAPNKSTSASARASTPSRPLWITF